MINSGITATFGDNITSPVVIDSIAKAESSNPNFSFAVGEHFIMAGAAFHDATPSPYTSQNVPGGFEQGLNPATETEIGATGIYARRQSIIFNNPTAANNSGSNVPDWEGSDSGSVVLRFTTGIQENGITLIGSGYTSGLITIPAVTRARRATPSLFVFIAIHTRESSLGSPYDPDIAGNFPPGWTEVYNQTVTPGTKTYRIQVLTSQNRISDGEFVTQSNLVGSVYHYEVQGAA